MPIFDPSSLVGMTFFLNKEGGKCLRARIVKTLDNHEGLRFVCSMQDDTVEEVCTCNEILDYINNSEEEDLVEWKFQAIPAHEGPLLQLHPNCNAPPLQSTSRMGKWRD